MAKIAKNGVFQEMPKNGNFEYDHDEVALDVQWKNNFGINSWEFFYIFL